MTTLQEQIQGELAALRELLGRQRTRLTALEHALPAAVTWTGEVRHLQIDMTDRLNRIAAFVGKEVMIGEIPPARRQETAAEMELFAATMPAPVKVPMFPTHEVREDVRFRRELAVIGDDTFQDAAATEPAKAGTTNTEGGES